MRTSIYKRKKEEEYINSFLRKQRIFMLEKKTENNINKYSKIRNNLREQNISINGNTITSNKSSLKTKLGKNKCNHKLNKSLDLSNIKHTNKKFQTVYNSKEKNFQNRFKNLNSNDIKENNVYKISNPISFSINNYSTKLYDKNKKLRRNQYKLKKNNNFSIEKRNLRTFRNKNACLTNIKYNNIVRNKFDPQKNKTSYSLKKKEKNIKTEILRNSKNITKDQLENKYISNNQKINNDKNLKNNLNLRLNNKYILFNSELYSNIIQIPFDNEIIEDTISNINNKSKKYDKNFLTESFISKIEPDSLNISYNQKYYTHTQNSKNNSKNKVFKKSKYKRLIYKAELNLNNEKNNQLINDVQNSLYKIKEPKQEKEKTKNNYLSPINIHRKIFTFKKNEIIDIKNKNNYLIITQKKCETTNQKKEFFDSSYKGNSNYDKINKNLFDNKINYSFNYRHLVIFCDKMKQMNVTIMPRKNLQLKLLKHSKRNSVI